MTQLFPTSGAVFPTGGASASVTPAWGNYLTLADLDSGGSADSDPGSILTSLTEPAAGELLFTVAPDGTVRDGCNEGARFDITSALNGWFDAAEIVPGGSGVLAVNIKIVSVSDATAQPLMGFGVYSTANPSVAAWVGIKPTLTNQTSDRGNATTNGAVGLTTWASGDHFGEIRPNINRTGSDTSNRTMEVSSIVHDSNGYGPAANCGTYSLWPANVLDDPTSWTAFVWVGNDIASATAFALGVKVRLHYSQWRPE